METVMPLSCFFAKLFMFSAPVSIVKVVEGPIRLVVKALPETFWHSRQWRVAWRYVV
jgi:hypothetical protein